MAEVELLRALPKGKRNVKARGTAKTPEHIRISREYGETYFDGPREYGYGGYRYDGRWQPVAKDIVAHFGLKPGDRVLDVGCAKGFLVKDLMIACPGLEVFGLDISRYALMNCEREVIGRLHLEGWLEDWVRAVRAGAIEKTAHAVHGRVLRLTATAKGQALLKRCRARVQEVEGRIAGLGTGTAPDAAIEHVALDVEAALVERCAAGDETAYAELVSEHQRMVVQLAMNLLGDHDEALDLSQEVFLRVFRTLPQFRGHSSLKTWIYRIVINQASNRQRWWRRRHGSCEQGRERSWRGIDWVQYPPSNGAEPQ